MSVLTRVILLACGLAGSMAAGNPELALPALPWLTGASWVIADFDGDGHPDVLTSAPESGGQNSGRNLVELRLGSGATVHSSFQVPGAVCGLNVFARDLDGDHDLDLVITEGFSNLPVGVWINDGEGVFTQGDAAAYPPSIWNPSDPVLARLPSSYANICAVRESRRADALPVTGASAPLRSSPDRTSPRPNGHLPFFTARQLSSRAPPAFF
jgi:hypothetical protein